MKSEGFYRKGHYSLIYTPTKVLNKYYELLSELKDTYKYPAHGWYWFDSLEDACKFFEIDPKDHQNSQRIF